MIDIRSELRHPSGDRHIWVVRRDSNHRIISHLRFTDSGQPTWDLVEQPEPGVHLELPPTLVIDEEVIAHLTGHLERLANPRHLTTADAERQRADTEGARVDRLIGALIQVVTADPEHVTAAIPPARPGDAARLLMSP